jgi:hypothetical protein
MVRGEAGAICRRLFLGDYAFHGGTWEASLAERPASLAPRNFLRQQLRQLREVRRDLPRLVAVSSSVADRSRR